MTDQQKQTAIDMFPVLAVELSPEQINGIKILNEETECLQWKKKFEESKATIAALENKILKVMERKGVVESKNSSARNLVKGYLKTSLTSETDERFENILRVLDPDPDEFTCNCHSTQQTLTHPALSSVEAESSLGVRHTGAQNSLDIPVTERKRRQVSVGNKVSQKKVRREQRPGLQSITSTRKRGKSLSPSAAEQVVSEPRAIIKRVTIPRTPAQSGTLHLATNGHEDLDEDSNLTPLQISAAVESFSKSLLKNVDDDTEAMIKKLCMRLKCDPVALQLAVSYINKDLLVIADPIKDIIENYFVKIDSDIARGGRNVSEPVENPCYLNLRVTCEKIRAMPGIGEKAIKVLEIISFLAADYIPTQFVLDLFDSMETQESSTTRKNIFQLLKRFSVINLGSGDSISVHPLIQEAIRNYLEEQEKFTEILGRIQRGTHEIIKKTTISCEQITQIQSIWEHATKNTTLIKEDGKFPSSICRELIELGKYTEAFDLSCRALTFLESTLQENHLWILSIKRWKGVAHFYLGENSKALELLSDVHEKQKELFGEYDEDCLETANRIGVVHLRLKKYEKALKVFRNTLEKRKKISSEEHLETVSLKHNIATVLEEQGKYEEAIELFQQVLEVEERVRGKNDLSTLATKFSMATLRFSQRKYKDALKLFQEVLQAEGNQRKVNPVDTLNTKNWIAATYRCLRKKNKRQKSLL